MAKRWWGAAPTVLVLAGALALSGGVGAQDTTVPDDELGLVAEIHAGTCAELETDVAFALGDLTRTGDDAEDTDDATAGGFADLGDGLVGEDDAAPVWTTQETIDAGPEELFDDAQSYAVVVGEEGPTGAVAACGDLGGVVANGAVTVALLPGAETEAGTLAGVAVFDAPEEARLTIGDEDETPATDDDADEQTRVTVYVVQLAEAAPAEPTEAPLEEASPAPVEEASPAPDEEEEPAPTATATEEPTGSPTA